MVSACSPSQVIREAVVELKLQAEENFVLKVVQLEELLQVRHSVFVVGNAGCGKSQVGPDHPEDMGPPWPRPGTSRGLPRPPALPEQCLGRGQQRQAPGAVCQPLQLSGFGITAQGGTERDTPGRAEQGQRADRGTLSGLTLGRMTDRARAGPGLTQGPVPGLALLGELSSPGGSRAPRPHCRQRLLKAVIAPVGSAPVAAPSSLHRC